MIPPLTLEELEGAVKSGRKVAFHPDYVVGKPGEFTVKCVVGVGSYKMVQVNDGRGARSVASDGRGNYSGSPVFVWADSLVLNRSPDGKCHCASPKPVLLLVRTLCDNCGGEVV